MQKYIHLIEYVDVIHYRNSQINTIKSRVLTTLKTALVGL